MALLCLWASENNSDTLTGDVLEILDDNAYPGNLVELPKFLLVKVEGKTRAELAFMLNPVYSTSITDPAGDPALKHAHPFRFDFQSKFSAAQLAAIQAYTAGWQLEIISLADVEEKA